MTNEVKKQIAKNYYLSFSKNEIRGIRMSPKTKGDVVLKVWNPTFVSEYNINVHINEIENVVFSYYNGMVMSTPLPLNQFTS